jgi:PAS domain S-box-containing protein
LGDVQHPAVAYSFSLALLAAAVLLRWLLDPVLGDELPLVTLFGAVAAAVWVGGARVAVLVTVVGYFACNYLFIEPRGNLLIWTAASAAGAAAYVLTCALIVGFGEAMRAAHARAAGGEALMRVTVASIGDAVITTDTHGRVTSLNTVAETLTGWTRHDAIGQPLESIFHIVNEATRQPVDNPALRALREGAVVGLANHTTLIARDGVERSIDDSAAPIKAEDGSIAGSVLIFRDISERRQFQRDNAVQLLAARQLASIVESSDDAIVRKALDGTIQSWNSAAERLFGYTADEAIGRHISLIIPGERIAEEDEIIAKLRKGQRVDHFETERRHRSGRLLWISLTISPITDSEGRVVAASKIARDITRQREVEAERQQMEDSLRKLAADLSTADRQKNEFLATLAHELRNPLAPLSHMLEVLKRVEGDPRARRVAIGTMERQLHQLVRLVDDLLDLNRITHNRLDLRKGPIDLRAVLDLAIESVRPLADAAGHEIRLIATVDSIQMSADAVRLGQVFGNLLNNSCKYTEPGGTITVRVERQDDEAVVTVEDTGAGIPPDRIDSIFDMFTQIERSREQAQGGLGIGLTLVRRLVQMHGGTIEASSAGEGKGSQFVVRLPIVHEPATAVAAAVAPREIPPRRILVVDDNQDAAASLSMLLELDGHQIIAAHDGAAAYEAAETHRPEVVLLDIGLPVLDGYEVCRRIRQEPWGRGILLVALTGWGQAEDRHRTRDAGFDAHLVKPVSYDALLTLLASLSVGR